MFCFQIYHAKFFDFCRRQKAVKEAFRFAKLIPDPTLSTFNMLMSVCSAAQDSEGKLKLAWLYVQVYFVLCVVNFIFV